MERRGHLLGDRQQIERTPAELDAVAGALVQRVLGAHSLGVLLAEPGEAEVFAHLLIRRGHEDQIACRLETLARE